MRLQQRDRLALPRCLIQFPPGCGPPVDHLVGTVMFNGLPQHLDRHTVVANVMMIHFYS